MIFPAAGTDKPAAPKTSQPGGNAQQKLTPTTGDLMRDSYPVTVARTAAVSTLTNQYVRRLLISILLTGFDGTVLLTTGRDVYEAASLMPWLAFVFTVLAVGLLLTLGHVWLLTFRARRPSAHLNHNPNPEERRFP
jgi:hypothetical protein